MIINSDCIAAMKEMEANTIDAIVTDPPYGLSFMGKGWDHGVPGVEFWSEALRVAKPGAHLLAFGGTRTYHRLTCAIEDAGWEIRDCVMWVYGSGFPKSHDVSKAIDKAAGAEREKVPATGGLNKNRNLNDDGWSKIGEVEPTMDSESPATDAARQWSGWGTALKPAWEPIILARKPLFGTVAENVLKHGTGGINVDGCRVGTDGGTTKGNPPKGDSNGIYGHGINGACDILDIGKGRWPANVIHDGSEEVVRLFPVTGASSGRPRRNTAAAHNATNSMGKSAADWTTLGHDDKGGSAARFFYCAKASKRDRDEGCEGLARRAAGGLSGRNDGTLGTITMSRNVHPTVKPTALMRYLCRLVTPPSGVVLDPFMGSGSTGKAAILEGFNFIGIERAAEYVEIARARIEHAKNQKQGNN